MGVEFSVIPGSAQELHDESIEPAQLCELNAELKAMDVLRTASDGIVIGADTLIVMGGSLFGKPKDLDDARRMLRMLSGRSHRVITGVCLCSASRKSVFHETTEVCFKELSDQTIESYLSAVHVLDKAGSYAVQEKREMIIAEVRGSYSNVVGLPVERLGLEFEKWGLRYSNRNR